MSLSDDRRESGNVQRAGRGADDHRLRLVDVELEVAPVHQAEHARS